jgi:hypothetical protein
LADIKCAHCGQPHAEGTKFCPKTGKQIGPPAGAKGTMIMFQPPAPHANGEGSGPVRVSTPPGLRTRTPTGTTAPRTSPTPTGTTALGERLSRLTPGVGIRVPQVPPPPVTVDNVPHPLAPSATPTPTPTPDPKRTSRPKTIPDWVADPDAAGAAATSAVFPAVDAPGKSVLQVLKDAFTLYRRHARDFLITAAILFLPGALISSAALAVITAPLRASAAGLEEAAASGTGAEAAAAAAAMGGLFAAVLGMLGWAVVALIVYGFVVPLTMGALTVAVADRALAGDASPWDYWRLLLGKLGPLLSALIPAAVLCAIGYFFFVIPGLVLSFLFVFVPAVVLIEGQSGVAALKRSVRLVRSDWIRVAIVLITFGLINFLAHLIGGALIPDRAFFLERVLGDLLTLALLPLPVLATVLLYLDVRRKTEALSREALHAELEAVRTPPDSPDDEDEIG